MPTTDEIIRESEKQNIIEMLKEIDKKLDAMREETNQILDTVNLALTKANDHPKTLDEALERAIVPEPEKPARGRKQKQSE